MKQILCITLLTACMIFSAACAKEEATQQQDESQINSTQEERGDEQTSADTVEEVADDDFESAAEEIMIAMFTALDQAAEEAQALLDGGDFSDLSAVYQALDEYNRCGEEMDALFDYEGDEPYMSTEMIAALEEAAEAGEQEYQQTAKELLESVIQLRDEFPL